MTKYDKALRQLGEYGMNPSAQSMKSLLDTDKRLADNTASICERLAKYCGDYWADVRHGSANAGTKNIILELLEELAQDGERRIKQRRDILGAFQARLHAGPYDLPKCIPAAAYGEPVIVKYLEDKGIFRIEIPSILPHRLDKGAHFLRDKVAYYMRKFTADWEEKHGCRPVINRAAVVFIHHYIEGERSNVLRDYDNLEHRCVLNALQCTGLFADSPAHMVTLEMMKYANNNCTEVLIAPVGKLPNIVSEMDFGVSCV